MKAVFIQHYSMDYSGIIFAKVRLMEGCISYYKQNAAESWFLSGRKMVLLLPTFFIGNRKIPPSQPNPERGEKSYGQAADGGHW